MKFRISISGYQRTAKSQDLAGAQKETVQFARKHGDFVSLMIDHKTIGRAGWTGKGYEFVTFDNGRPA